MDLSKLTLGDKIIGGTAIGMIITLLFFPWHNIDFGFVSETRSGVQSPNSFWGILALLLTIAVLAVTFVRKATDTELPDAPQPWGMLTFFGTIGVAAMVLIKLISETDYLGFGAWLAILLAGGMVYGGFLGKDETDGASSPAAGGDGGNATPF